MDHSAHTRLRAQQLNEATLIGAMVYDLGDERIGHVAKVVGTASDADVIIDVGGCLGICSKSVQVPVRDLDFMRDASNCVHAVSRCSEEDLSVMS